MGREVRHYDLMSDLACGDEMQILFGVVGKIAGKAGGESEEGRIIERCRSKINSVINSGINSDDQAEIFFDLCKLRGELGVTTGLLRIKQHFAWANEIRDSMKFIDVELSDWLSRNEGLIAAS